MNGQTQVPQQAWEYSEKAITVIAEYMGVYPEIFKIVSQDENADAYDTNVLVTALLSRNGKFISVTGLFFFPASLPPPA
jgi:hypothetical protein